MRLFTRVAILFYVTIVLFLGCFILAFALNWIPLNIFLDFFSVVYTEHVLKIILITLASFILLINFVFYLFFSINAYKEKTIAFYNPHGRVTVSLFAIEDLVRNTILKLPEIKEVKTSIKALKNKGLRVKARLIFRDEVNIPDTTERIQELIQHKIQAVIGISEPVTVEIYIGKFSLEKNPGKREKEELREELEPNVPFQGYRA